MDEYSIMDRNCEVIALLLDESADGQSRPRQGLLGTCALGLTGKAPELLVQAVQRPAFVGFSSTSSVSGLSW